MNIHINRYTHYQTWENKKIFDDYPIHIKNGKFTVTLLFQEKESILELSDTLKEMVNEIENNDWLTSETEDNFEVPF